MSDPAGVHDVAEVYGCMKVVQSSTNAATASANATFVNTTCGVASLKLMFRDTDIEELCRRLAALPCKTPDVYDPEDDDL